MRRIHIEQLNQMGSDGCDRENAERKMDHGALEKKAGMKSKMYWADLWNNAMRDRVITEQHIEEMRKDDRNSKTIADHTNG